MFANRLCNPTSTPDMSSVWPKPGLRLRSRTCPVQGPNMSRTCLWNPVTWSDKSGKDLAVSKSGADQTCPVQEMDMFDKCYLNPTLDPDKSREMRKTGWPRHIWAGGRICPILVTGIWLGNRLCPDFLEGLVQMSFSMICILPTHSMHPP
jgi:hypothetical protein